MLSEYTVNIANSIAEQLATDGMIWGKELEWYIRQCFKDLGEIETEEQYLEIENTVLESVGKRKKRIKVTDTKTNKVFYLKNIDEAVEHFNCKRSTFESSLYRGTRLKFRYKIEYANPNYKEI